MNAVVCEVSNFDAQSLVQVGDILHSVNGYIVFGMDFEKCCQVLQLSECPVRLGFVSCRWKHIRQISSTFQRKMAFKTQSESCIDRIFFNGARRVLRQDEFVNFTIGLDDAYEVTAQVVRGADANSTNSSVSVRA